MNLNPGAFGLTLSVQPRLPGCPLCLPHRADVNNTGEKHVEISDTEVPNKLQQPLAAAAQDALEGVKEAVPVSMPAVLPGKCCWA